MWRILLLVSIVSAQIPLVYDNLSIHEIESVDSLNAVLLESGGIVQVQNDSSVIVPIDVLENSMSLLSPPAQDQPNQMPSLYVQTDLSSAKFVHLPSHWTPIGLCIDNSASETPTTVTKTYGMFLQASFGLRLHTKIFGQESNLRTTLMRAQYTAQKVFCEVLPGKVVQPQMKTSSFVAKGALQRTISVRRRTLFNREKIVFGEWTKVPDDEAIYNVGYTFGCVTSEHLLQCGETTR